MTDIVNWFPAAADNVMQPPDGLPEHCLPSAVNDWARENMAAVRRWYSATPLNVMNFGAKGDGTTDDTAAIQTAVTEAADKSLFFPPGNYLVRGSITLPDASVRLYGDSMTITADVAINWPTSIVGSCFIGDPTLDLHEYMFDGLGFAWPVGGTGSILYLPSPTILTIKNCSSSGGSSFAQLSDVNNLTFTNNVVANFDAFGLYLNGDCNFIRCTNNHFVTTDTALQALTTCIYYSGIKSDNTGGTAYSTIIAHNHFRILAHDGIGVWVNPHPTDGGSVDLMIANNQFYANGLSAYGVFVGGSVTAHNIQIMSNYFEGATTDTAQTSAIIVISPSNNIQIINNMANAWNAGTQGVFNFSGDHGILAGNLGTGCSSPFIYTAGTDIQLVANNDGGFADIDITGRYKMNGHTLASTDNQYTRLHTPTSSDNISIFLGNQIDPTNYYRNTLHLFEDIAGTTNFAQIGSFGVSTPQLSVSGNTVLTNLIVNSSASIGAGLFATSAIIHNGLSSEGHTDLVGTVSIGGNVSCNQSINAVDINLSGSIGVVGSSVLNGTVTANTINAGNLATSGNFSVAGGSALHDTSINGACVIGENISLGTNHVSDFALFTDVSNGNTTLQFGTGTFFTLSRATGRVQLWVGGVFQQQWPA